MFKVPITTQRKFNKAALKMVEVRHGNSLERDDLSRFFERRIVREPTISNDYLDRAVEHHENLVAAFNQNSPITSNFESLACSYNIARYLLEPYSSGGMSHSKQWLYQHGLNSVFVPTILRAEINAMDFAKAYDLGVRNYIELVKEEIRELQIVERFGKDEWRAKLVADMRFVVAPLIVTTIAIAWQLAIEEA